MTLKAVGQIALPVSDADRSLSFYRDLLGLPLLFRFGDLIFLDCFGVRLMLEGVGKDVRPGTGICHYIKSDAIDADFEALAALGIEFEDRPHIIARLPDHELWMVFFRDPDGHLWGLMEERRLL